MTMSHHHDFQVIYPRLRYSVTDIQDTGANIDILSIHLRFVPSNYNDVMLLCYHNIIIAAIGCYFNHLLFRQAKMNSSGRFRSD